jgi:RNA polymerase sigma-70 factor (ECF subfamily)
MRRTPDFDALYARFRERVFALCLHVTRNRAEAEDAFQETFLAVHADLPKFRAQASASTWIYRIALHTALRQRKRARTTEPLDAGAHQGFEIERTLAARDEVRKLRVAMEGLSVEQRAVLSLFAVDGLGHTEIAEILEVPVGTVWSRLHGARKRLFEALNPGTAPT